MQRRELYPEIEPFETGRLPVGDGHELYFEQCGNPTGKPVVFLHGGPGAGCNDQCAALLQSGEVPDRAVRPARLRPFDAARQSGRQHHLASGRRHRTPAQASGRSSAGRCSAAPGDRRWRWPTRRPIRSGSTQLVLRGIFMLRRWELEWFYQSGADAIFPDAWDDYLAAIPEVERGDLMSAYHRRLTVDRSRGATGGRQGMVGVGRRAPVICSRIPITSRPRRRTCSRSPLPASSATTSSTAAFSIAMTSCWPMPTG